MLKRKISETLKEWKEQPNHSPLVIMGIRQCGKTYISQLFAEENYKHVVYINFIKQKKREEAFYDSKDVDSIILNLSAQMRTAKFVPGETCIILDEVPVTRDRNLCRNLCHNLKSQFATSSL